VRREGRSWSHPLIILIACANGRDETRLGFTASKALGNAVKRNRARRRLRSAAHPVAAQLHLGWDIVLVARPALSQANWPAVLDALSQLFRRAKLLKDG